MSLTGAEDLLARARGRIARLTPSEAWQQTSSGRAVLVDIRSGDARVQDGVVPGSVHIPRTVLEWRLDPASTWRNPHVAGSTKRIVVLCDHGMSSSLAAAALLDLGYADAADVDGGMEAWHAAGLPVSAVNDRSLASGELPGMGSPSPL